MDNIEICFEGSGHYWLTDGDGQIDLGHCSSEEELTEMVGRAIEAGSGEEDWRGWRATQ